MSKKMYARKTNAIVLSALLMCIMQADTNMSTMSTSQAESAPVIKSIDQGTDFKRMMITSSVSTTTSTTPTTTKAYTTTTTTTTSATTTTQEVVIEVENLVEEPVCVEEQPQSISDSDFILLCNAVGHEAGSNWISTYDKALVVEVIMNRVESTLYPNSIYDVLTQPNQFSGAWGYANWEDYTNDVTEEVKTAVEYYFDNPEQFQQGYFKFWGDGYQNHFG